MWLNGPYVYIITDILKSNNKVKTILKIIKDRIVEENPSIKVNNYVINSFKLTENSFDIYFLDYWKTEHWCKKPNWRSSNAVCD